MNQNDVAGTNSSSPRILVVEDELMLQTLVETILQSQGYQVRTAASAEEALQVWRHQGGGFELLLTDMVLPDGMTGRQLAETLQAQKPGLKVIYASGFTADSIDGGEFLQEGVNFLSKPYTTRGLAQTVHQCLASEHQLPTAKAA